jgi:uncharacterized RDD family membrane protein YckC
MPPVAATVTDDPQPSLFPREERPKPRVIRFEAIAPPGHLMAPPRGKDRKRSADADTSQADEDLQQCLDLQVANATNHSRTFSDTTLFLPNRAANPLHRMCAALLDLGLIGVGLGIFMATFYLAGGEIVLNKVTTPLYALVPLLVAFCYRALYCLGNGDTAGLQWLGLRLVDFDGHAPRRRDRWVRTFGGGVSAIAGGLGLVWALSEEERLTWHDLMSKTFPTPDPLRLRRVTRRKP